MIDCARGLPANHTLEQVNHMLSAVVRVADQLGTIRINDEIKRFQRDLTDKWWAIVRDFADFDDAVAILDG